MSVYFILEYFALLYTRFAFRLGEVKSKSKFNSLDRIGRKKTESRKNNKNPPSLVVVDTDEAQTKHNSTLSRKDKKKKRQVNCHPLPVLLMDVLSTLQSGTERVGGCLLAKGGLMNG